MSTDLLTVPRRRRIVTDFHVDQFSGRWDRKPAAVERQTARSVKDMDRTIILLTEVANDARARAALRGARTSGHRWHMVRDADADMGEVAILVRLDVWEVLRERVKVLGPDLGPGGRVIGAFALLRNRYTGHTLVVSTAHLPASVEGDWTTGHRAAEHRKAVDVWRRTHRAWRRAFKPDAELAWADWNLNLHRDWVADWIDEAWPALDLPSEAVIPSGGTHAGGRLIDWFVCRGLRVRSWRILRWPWASDHHGNRAALRIVTYRAVPVRSALAERAYAAGMPVINDPAHFVRITGI